MTHTNLTLWVQIKSSADKAATRVVALSRIMANIGGSRLSKHCWLMAGTESGMLPLDSIGTWVLVVAGWSQSTYLPKISKACTRVEGRASSMLYWQEQQETDVQERWTARQIGQLLTWIGHQQGSQLYEVGRVRECLLLCSTWCISHFLHLW